MAAKNMLVHVDYLDETIERLGEEIGRVIAPFFSEEVELLGTIPGVGRRTAETLIAEIGVDMRAGCPPLGTWLGGLKDVSG